MAERKTAFYCQLDYEHVPYPSPVGAKNGNIANNGCGVCAASMVAENMLGVSFPPEESAKLAKACGAREGYGTDLYIYAPVFAQHVGLQVRDTEDAQEALRFLQEGRGMIIANVRGDREGHIGVFSNSGHYIVLAGAKGTEVKVWDPMYKEGSGRFDVPGRKGKVRLDGTDAYADFAEIEKDCFERPFFLFWKA
ncbi:MAG: C39 family peptidase [Clostridia bacterium]|nr:C39 family peptidase [Clostridia bacterium]